MRPVTYRAKSPRCAYYPPGAAPTPSRLPSWPEHIDRIRLRGRRGIGLLPVLALAARERRVTRLDLNGLRLLGHRVGNDPIAVASLPVARTVPNRTGGLVDTRRDVGSHRIGAVAEAGFRARRRWRRSGIRVRHCRRRGPADDEHGGCDSDSRHHANASTGGHEHIRFRSPYAPSMRRTGGHTLGRNALPSGYAACSRV